jgi:3-hydroxybutyryl-CoA dehydrogenase
VKRGHLGLKSGKGFYDYSFRKMSDVLKERDLKLIKLMKFLKIPPSPPLIRED